MIETRSIHRNSLILFFALVVSMVCRGFGQEDYGTWSHSKAIMINTSATGYDISQTLTDFPYLVRLDASDSVFTQSLVSNGGDIRFAKGGVHLSYQVEEYNTIAKTGVIWVCVNSISGNNDKQVITMYWGKTGVASQSGGDAVFTTANNFAGVWHFAASAGFDDATSNALTLTNTNTTSGTSPLIGADRGFNGTNANLSSTGAALALTDNITQSAWVKSPDASADQKVMGRNGISNGEKGYLMAINGKLDAEYDGTRNSGGTIRNNVWTYIAVTFRANGNLLFYVNGSQVASSATGATALSTQYATSFRIGCPGWDQGSLLFSGEIDEARVENTVRSADWLKLCYLNQRVLPNAPPVIRYTVKHVFIPINTFTDSIIPSISGTVESLTITPFLPSNLMFDVANGVITGSAIDLTWEQPYYITAYNPKGSSTDTIFITIDNPTGVNSGKKVSGASPRLMGISGPSHQSRLVFSMPFPGEFSDITFTIFNVTGTAIMSSRVSPHGFESGIQSVPIPWLKEKRNAAGGLYFVEMKATNSRSGKTYVQRNKSMILK
jgi:hypothetical protein